MFDWLINIYSIIQHNSVLTTVMECLFLAAPHMYVASLRRDSPEWILWVNGDLRWPGRMTLQYVVTRWRNDRTNLNTFKMKVKYYCHNHAITFTENIIGETWTKTVLNLFTKTLPMMEPWLGRSSVPFKRINLSTDFFGNPLGEGNPGSSIYLGSFQ